MTITSAVDQYISFCRSSGKTAATISSYTATLTRLADFLKSAGRDDVETVTPPDLVAFKCQCAKSVSATTLRLFMTHINCFCEFLSDMEIIQKSPYKKGLMTVEKSAIREATAKPYENILTADDLIRIATGTPKYAKQKNILRNRALLLTFLTTGLRNESVRELKISDVEWEHNRIRVRSAKGGKTGYAPLTSVAASAIRDYINSEKALDPETPLFRTTGKAIGRQHMSQIVMDAVREYTGKDGYETHALRHSFASILAHEGFLEAEISLLLFHSDKSGAAVTARYIERDNTSLFRKVNGLFTKLIYGAA